MSKKKPGLGDPAAARVPEVPVRVDPGALPPDGPPLVTGKQLAANLGVSGKTIGRLVRSGQIPAVKIGDLWRFDVGVVRRALDKKTRK